MKKLFLALAFVVGSFVYSQETTITVTPKTFKNTISIQTELVKETNIEVKIYNEANLVKALSFQNVMKNAFKVDLKDLAFNKTYTIKIYNSENTLLFTDKITKALKY